MEPYLVPLGFHRTQTEVAKSRFIASSNRAETADEAKAFIAQIRAEMPDASHHVYAFRAGFGQSVIEGMSDDGEPSGTSGPPVLAVLRGSGIGDLVMVITRYFGGTKLGTGGLVRAYTEAAHININSMPTELKIEKRLLGIDVPYSLYEQVKRLIAAHQGVIQDETFMADVSIIVTFALKDVPAFTADLTELSAGKIHPITFD